MKGVRANPITPAGSRVDLLAHIVAIPAPRLEPGDRSDPLRLAAPYSFRRAGRPKYSRSRWVRAIELIDTALLAAARALLRAYVDGVSEYGAAFHGLPPHSANQSDGSDGRREFDASIPDSLAMFRLREDERRPITRR